MLAGPHVVLPAVPWAGQDAALEPPFAERASKVEAVRLSGVEAAVAVGEHDLLVAGPDRSEASWRHFLGARDGHECAFHPGDPSRGLSRGIRPRYAPGVATILLCGVDVFFRGKLEALLPGHRFVTSDSADWPDLVMADISRVDPADVADSYPDVPIVGFGGHTDTAGLRRAHEAGFDQVLVKNALQERAPQIVEELIASVE